MLASTVGALYVVTGFEKFGLAREAAWSAGYLAMAALVVIGIITALLATKPEAPVEAEKEKGPARVWHAAIGAFSEFLSRDAAFVVLGFVILYKFCDAFAGTMTAPFVIDLGLIAPITPTS
jgi:PAT family beta-lactamase induction signal transducer AmpG